MNVLDGHIHIAEQATPDPKGFAAKLKEAGVRGGIVISPRPASFHRQGQATTPKARLETLFAWCESDAELYPFYWIDPTEDSAVDQVLQAAERGVAGFKIICDHFYAGDPRTRAVYQTIARESRPLMFHSGILWDGKPSSQYSRPVNFEAMLEIEKIRFSMAHISWPWVDEMIAVYGKFAQARRGHPEMTAELFIDTTPGTPIIYRREALTKVFTVGYDVIDNVWFGSDNGAANYNSNYAKEWIARDQEIMRELGLGEAAIEKVFCDNLRRFVGVA